MGKTPKPLTILCHPMIYAWDEVQALKAQGHRIDSFADLDLESPMEYDLILSPTAWYCDGHHRPYLPLAIKAARVKRYGKSRKDEDPDG